MPYRAMVLVAASLLFATQCYAESAINNSKSNSFKQTKQPGGTERGFFPTTGSDRARMGGDGSGNAAARSTTVKSSKSNTNDRMGGGGGGKGTSGANWNPGDRMGGGGGTATSGAGAGKTK